MFVNASLSIMIGRQTAIGVFVNANSGANELWPQRARRDVQDQVARFDRAVVADSARLLDTQDLADPAAQSGTRALPASPGAIAKAALCCAGACSAT